MGQLMRIKVHKETEPYPAFHNMWIGTCWCGETWQFWFWGATLGFGFEHLWKEHRA